MNQMIHLRAVLIFVLFLQFSAWSRPVFAEIKGGPHDLYTQGYLQASEERKQSEARCILCHVSPTDTRPLIWQVVPDSIKRYGAIGNQCASCHDGISMVDRNVDGGMTVFNPESHGSDPENAPVDTDVRNTGLPYVTGSIIECSTCHDTHLQKYRPFMRVPLIGMCQGCHLNREHFGFGTENTTGSHPVGVDPFDNTGGPSPIDIDAEFSVPFPQSYPSVNAILSPEGHWTLGGHLSFGGYGQIECSTCHSFHGVENVGPYPGLLSKDPVKIVSNEFCEGCHKGIRGDDKREPPYPNPGGTITGRTYHPVDDDEANGIGWITAIADTTERSYYDWGEIDTETDLPVLLCTTCHVAHNGMENSPALVPIADETSEEGVESFCEICHREPPKGHHGYSDEIITTDDSGEMIINIQNLGQTFGQVSYDRVYCSYCHKAHNAGFGAIEPNYIPLLVDSSSEICLNCHDLGVSHFMGDPTLASTYQKPEPSLYRDLWPETDLYSRYDGPLGNQVIITCVSCHYLSNPGPEGISVEDRLFAPAGEGVEWEPGYPEDYLCTGCHGESPATVGEGKTHSLIQADGRNYPVLESQLDSGETTVSYTDGGGINCHSCHKAHKADLEGGVYILKMGHGQNTDPKAIRPQVMYEELCLSCHDK